MIAGWLAQARGWLDQNPDLGLVMLGGLILVMAVLVVTTTPRRWK